jgi:hypothetical protein
LTAWPSHRRLALPLSVQPLHQLFLALGYFPHLLFLALDHFAHLLLLALRHVVDAPLQPFEPVSRPAAIRLRRQYRSRPAKQSQRSARRRETYPP